MENYEIVKADFNKIAETPEPRWNHNSCYFKSLLKHIPKKAGLCLDIGCGKGALTLLLSQKAARVIGVDLSDNMIRYAQTHNRAENIEYRCGNVLDMPFDDASLDVIITTATAHHLPYEWLLAFARRKLKRGGRLIVLDLAKAASVTDHIVWGAAFLPNIIMNIIINGKLRKEDGHARAVWEAHEKHDTYMTMAEIRKLAARHLAGAVIRRKLFWRYTLTWEKQSARDA